MKTLADIFGTPEHGHSGCGISYYSEFYKCARKANLAAQQQALVQLETEEGDEIVATDVGTAYHALHEADIKMEIGAEALVDAREVSYSPSHREALRLFRGWKATWGSLESKYGMSDLRAEFPIGSEGEPVEGLDAPLTGRVDFVGHIGQEGLQTVFGYLGIELPGEGYYLGDFKTSGSKNKNDSAQYTYGLQAQAYLYLWNQKFPGTPARGIIFDQIVRHKDLKGGSFVTHVAYPDPNAKEMLRAFIHGAIALREANRANASACIDKFSNKPL
jgi:hypothetical protein